MHSCVVEPRSEGMLDGENAAASPAEKEAGR